MWRRFVWIGSALVLWACATMPSGPGVLVLPGDGRDDGQFRKDEAACRQAAHVRIATAPVKPETRVEAQRLYDIAYIQCMYGKGHRVPVPADYLYETRGQWHPPPPPNLPPPPSMSPAAP